MARVCGSSVTDCVHSVKLGGRGCPIESVMRSCFPVTSFFVAVMVGSRVMAEGIAAGAMEWFDY